ncbi:Uncharacterised protein [Campylobacter sputorum subsp. bubulus]|uniref:DUF177 domain-containing protein n=1 Tax=Campylobacter sputorum subsp. sputorum TaxID=32024 RepID=A0A381DJ53_9BACT|nr:hypothetical protein [Campylobacter sputorum]ASM35670.1 hypothetical protein CSPUT_1486 [Campylobacter sputorum aubsp. sputorum RM3237]ASM37388.1 hypothetical protein CSF_1541 [Campylobacter sputorum bv. faecalis CCUG 20703]KAB0582600.1 hypothetical protein F7P64_00185 [Campylobacter sputorum subsp. sputorum]QEL05862.1 hypothetical protein CSPT_1484 [Campylobacter sputorum subsp. sputorum]SUX07918.1 Uncharacterised protein [Campylobacter sputorum subsp. bubulus]
MKIAFSTINKNDYPFEFKKEDIKLSGNLKKIGANLVNCDAHIKGNLPYICSRCGDDIMLRLDYDLSLILSNGYYKDEDGKLDDVIEFFDGNINLDEIITSEIESYKSDCFYCEKCKI